jgi:hypothetical protein
MGNIRKIILLAKLLDINGAYEESDFVIRQAGQFGNDFNPPWQAEKGTPGNARGWSYYSDQEYSDGSQTMQEEKMTKGPYWEGRHGPKDKTNLNTDDSDYNNQTDKRKRGNNPIPPTEMNNEPDDGVAYISPFDTPSMSIQGQEDETSKYGYDETRENEAPYAKYLLH